MTPQQRCYPPPAARRERHPLRRQFRRQPCPRWPLGRSPDTVTSQTRVPEENASTPVVPYREPEHGTYTEYTYASKDTQSAGAQVKTRVTHRATAHEA